MKFLYYSTDSFLLSSKEVLIFCLEFISSYYLRKNLNKEWSNICFIVNLFLGLNNRILLNRSRNCSFTFFILLVWDIYLLHRICLIIELHLAEPIDYMSDSDGIPVKLKIFSNWSVVELPGKRGFLYIIS